MVVNQYKRATEAGDGLTFDALAATGETNSGWIDVSAYSEVTCFLEATYANQSGATLDVDIEVRNPKTGTAFTHTSFTQLTGTGSERKVLTSGFAGQIRFELTAGGTFGETETITPTIDVYLKKA